MSTMNLVLYIDSSLLGQLATFTFSRVVNGQSNVIFQSKAGGQILHSNDFQWQQAYQIGATQTFSQGTLVSSSTSQQNIQPGYACAFSNNDLQPEAPAPSSFPAGSFGTTGLPATLKNAIYSATGSGPGATYTAIYADDSAIPGLTNRSYIVENKYVVSWESASSNTSAGVYYQQWSDPWAFEYSATQSAGYISWGPPTGGGIPQFYWYGATDPKGHDPSKSIPTGVSLIKKPSSSPLGEVGSTNSSVGLQLGWEGLDWLSAIGKAQYASKTADYLLATRPSFLDLAISNNNSQGLAAVANLNGSDSIYDFLDGSNRQEKTALILQSMLRGAATKYAPSEQNIQFYEATAAPLVNWSAIYTLAWKFAGSAVAAAAVPVAFSYIQGLINQKYGNMREVTIKYSKPAVTGVTGGASFTLTGVNAGDAAAIISGINSILNGEEARKTQPPTPAGLPTPDPLTYTETTPQATNFSGVLVITDGSEADDDEE